MVGSCPYRGLSAFREADAPFFHGRETFTTRLVEVMHAQPPVAVIVGSSGSGKSSAVYAGLLPRLRAEGSWLIAEMRPGGQPFDALAAVLLPLLEPGLSETDRLIESRKLAGALREAAVPLVDVVARALSKAGDTSRMLLLVDQFEELYTLCPEVETRRRFLDTLLAAVEETCKLRPSPFVLLVTMRADFMGQALSYRPFADLLQGASLMMGPMTRDELRAAIVKPAEKQGAALEPGLVERLLDDVGEEPGNLPLLEFALTLLWERLDAGWMTHAAYDEIGRVEGALARYAEEVYQDLAEEEREGARWVFEQLVQPGEGTEDTRRVATRAEIGEERWALVQHLADRRLVVTGRDATAGHGDRRGGPRGADPALGPAAGVDGRGPRLPHLARAAAGGAARLGGQRSGRGRPAARRAAGPGGGVAGRAGQRVERGGGRLHPGRGGPARAAASGANPAAAEGSRRAGRRAGDCPAAGPACRSAVAAGRFRGTGGPARGQHRPGGAGGGGTGGRVAGTGGAAGPGGLAALSLHRASGKRPRPGRRNLQALSHPAQHRDAPATRRLVPRRGADRHLRRGGHDQGL